MTRHHSQDRRGVAAVEMAILLMPMLIMLAGTWEVARFIEAQQILTNAAREGIRLAVSGQSTDAYGTGLQQGDTYIVATPANSGNYNFASGSYVQATSGTGQYTLVRDAVKQVVVNYIANAGLDTSTLDANAVTITNLSQPGNPGVWQAPINSGGSGANQNDHMRVTVTYPASKIRWVFLPGIINLGSSLTASVDWQSVEDIPVSVGLTVGPN